MSRSRRSRVLIIDDDALNVELLQVVLEGAGFQTHAAADARAGIDLAHRLHPDVVLMDLQLPGMDGLEATRALRADEATARIPVIAVTAHVKRDDEDRCLAAGCARHVPKPIDTRALPKLVREVIEAARSEASIPTGEGESQ